MPQSHGRIVSARHPRVLAVQQGMGLVLLGVVEGNGLLKVCSGRGKLAPPDQRISERKMSLQEQRGVLYALGQAEELLCQRARCLVLPSHMIKRKQSPQHREELKSFPQVLAQLTRPGVGSSH